MLVGLDPSWLKIPGCQTFLVKNMPTSNHHHSLRAVTISPKSKTWELEEHSVLGRINLAVILPNVYYSSRMFSVPSPFSHSPPPPHPPPLSSSLSLSCVFNHNLYFPSLLNYINLDILAEDFLLNMEIDFKEKLKKNPWHCKTLEQGKWTLKWSCDEPRNMISFQISHIYCLCQALCQTLQKIKVEGKGTKCMRW